MGKLLVGGSSGSVFDALHRAGVFVDDPQFVRRVVIDLQFGEPARVYVERFVDRTLVDVILAGALEIVEKPA